MSSHSNLSQSHDFFYEGVDNNRSQYYSGVRLSFEGDEAFSYSTIIAKVIPAKNKKRADTRYYESGLTLLSMDSMSSTTGGHISLIGSASPFEVVHVPFKYGSRYISPKILARRIEERLSHLKENFNHIDKRREFASLLLARKIIIDRASNEWSKPLQSKKLNELASVDIGKISEELKAKKRKEAAKLANATRKARETFYRFLHNRKGSVEYLDLLHVIFDRWYVSPFKELMCIDNDIRKKMAKDLGLNMSYVWVSGEDIVTSRGVRIPIHVAKIAMNAWEDGRDMRNFQVGGYSIIKYEGDEIKIGCHRIPRENMLALFEVVMGRPFNPVKKEDVKS